MLSKSTSLANPNHVADKLREALVCSVTSGIFFNPVIASSSCGHVWASGGRAIMLICYHPP